MALDVYIEIVQVTLNQFPATTNVTSINMLTAGITPKAAVFLGARQPSATPTVEDNGARNVMGFAVNGGNQVGSGAATENVGGGQTAITTTVRNNAVIGELNEAPSIGVFLNAWITGGVNISYSPTSSQNKIIYVMLIGGADVTAYAAVAAVSGTTPYTQSITAPGFQPDVVLFSTTNSNSINTKQSYNGIQFGVATATQNRCIYTSSAQSFFTSNPMAEAVWNTCAIVATDPSTAANLWKAVATMTATGYDLAVTGGSPSGDLVAYLALKLDGGGLSLVDIIDWNTPGSTGVDTIVSGLGYLPGALITGNAGLTTWGAAINTDPSCVAGIGMAAVNVEGGNSWRTLRGSNPLNSGTLTDSNVVRLGSKSSMTSGGNVANLSGWSSGQVDLNYSAVGQPGTQSFGVVFYNKAGLIASDVRLPLTLVEVLTDGDPNVRAPLIFSEGVVGGVPLVHLPLTFAEGVIGGNPNVHLPLCFVEVFRAIPVEVPVATEVLPITSPINAPLSLGGTPPLVGLSWDVGKKPMFRTDVQSAISGKELRTARMQYPIYQFTLHFNFLRETEGRKELETLMGFFMTQLGSWGAWLYQDPSDYLLQDQLIGVADGGITGFTIMRSLGGFTNPIGQYDLHALFTWAAADVNTGANTIAVPGHGLATGYGPLQATTPGSLPGGLAVNTNYWIIVVNSGVIKLASSRANALAGTAIDLSTAGSGTTTASNSVAVYVAGVEVDPDDYTLVAPNEVVFDSAPLTGDVTVDCKFYFVCRFMEDVADFNEFMSNLWELETLEFQSIV